MLKLPKALKKKKKGKKHKKDQELFTEEELAEYKKQLQLKQQQEQQQQQDQENQQDQTQQQETNQEREGDSDEAYDDNNVTTEHQQRRKSSDKNSKEEDEEWLKFKNLTAGVDSLLHKTQDDLSRIKSTSFFQRVPPPSEREKEKAEAEEEEKKNQIEQDQKESPEHDKLAEAVVDLSDLDDDSDESEDDIFDTAYIDAITSGEIQLTVVPDSPDLEINEGPDPFDTSYAEKLIKGPEVSKRGKKIVNIGPAVEVLTGRLDSTQAVSVSGIKRKPRRGIQNLLLDDFDDEQTVNASQVSSSTSAAVETVAVSEAAPPKSLLDDPADEIPDIPVDLSVSLHLQLLKNKDTDKTDGELENSTEDTVGVVDEQNDNNNQEDKFEENQEEDDEFAALAAESLTKKEVTTVVVIKPTEPTELIVESEVSDGDWAHFEQQPQEELEEQKTDIKQKAKPQRPPKPAILAERLKNEDSLEFNDIVDDDPFDTAFAEKIIDTQQTVNNKRISLTDNNLLTEENSSFITANLINAITTSITNTQVNTIERQIDDLFDLGEDDITLPEPLTEASVLPVPTTDFDPFDTSTVEGLVQPKSTELKFLEEELLTDLKHSLSDPDFDPRAIESEDKFQQIEVTNTQHSSSVSVAPYADAARRKSSFSLHLESTKSVAFLVPETKDESGKVHKPLTPYCTTVPEKDIPLDEDIDPFDTSFVIHCDTDELSDSEFDPRADEKFEAQIIDNNNPDFLTASTIAEEQINIKVLTPAQEFSLNKESELKEEEFIDPFDTSTIAANILPGKTELKFIENELLPAPSQSDVTEAVLDTQSDVQELGIGDKVLTPAQVKANNSIEETLEDIDPFDTSFAENLKPGQAELKVLETEFI